MKRAQLIHLCPLLLLMLLPLLSSSVEFTKCSYTQVGPSPVSENIFEYDCTGETQPLTRPDQDPGLNYTFHVLYVIEATAERVVRVDVSDDNNTLKIFFNDSNRPCKPFDDFAYDTQLQRMFVYCSKNGGEIFVMNTFATKVSLVLSNVGAYVRQLKYDMNSGTLFWLDTAKSELYIGVADGSQRRKKLMGDLGNPIKLLVLPRTDTLLVYSQVKETKNIIKANLAGQNVRIVKSLKQNLTDWTSDLDDNKRIWWTDGEMINWWKNNAQSTTIRSKPVFKNALKPIDSISGCSTTGWLYYASNSRAYLNLDKNRNWDEYRITSSPALSQPLRIQSDAYGETNYCSDSECPFICQFIGMLDGIAYTRCLDENDEDDELE